MVLNEMTRLQEELYSNLDELQTRINELQSKKVRAEESRWRSNGELDKAKKAYRALKSDLEAEATKTATLTERNRALKSDRKTLTKTVKSLEG
jgi:predicted nuclease with TOPRIM domain